MQRIHDYSREGLTLSKLLHAFSLFLPKNTRTLTRLKKFSDLDLTKIKNGSNIKGIILDVDGCIAYEHKEILPENLQKIKELTDLGMKIVIYSNMIWSPRYEKLKGVIVLANVPPKPSRKGFEAALTALALPKENVVMIGDNYITDGGAIKFGIPFIHIEPLKNGEEHFASKLNNLFIGFFIWLSKRHEELRAN